MDVSSLVEIKKNPKIPDIAPGDTVRVSAKIVEGGKERIQVLQGVVIKIKRGGNGAGFTVRHVAFGVGVERTFPYSSPLVEKVVEPVAAKVNPEAAKAEKKPAEAAKPAPAAEKPAPEAQAAPPPEAKE